MTVWDALRRFSGFGKRGKTGRARNAAGRRRPITGSLRGRDLRVEQFEQRMLLSISPTSFDQLSYLSSSVKLAIQQATDLDSYAEEDLASTQQWVVGLTGSGLTEPEFLAASLGADDLGPTGIIKNTYVWEFSTQTDWETVAAKLDAASGVAYAYPLVARPVTNCFVPDDALFAQQWHLQNTGQTGGTPGVDANVVTAWDSVTGEGVIIGIIDDGFDFNHPDLIANYRADLSYDYWDDDSDPSPEDGLWSSDNHGTAVAGVAAGVGNNSLGISGSAPDAEFAGIRLTTSWPTDLQTAQALSHLRQQIDIYNNSWGAKFDFPSYWGPLTAAALEQGVQNGRDGLGNIFVFSAGNGRDEYHNVNLSSLTNSRYTIAIAAIDADGVYSSYSTPGAAVFVSGHSSTMPLYVTEDGIVTTDRTGQDGYNSSGGLDGDSLPDVDYTSTFGGTSSSAPLVSGVIALMLEANPALTYRDVQYILAATAEWNDPTGSDWVVNGAGYHVSHDYGFGAIDAAAAVQAAFAWETVGEEVSDASNVVNVGQTIPDGSALGLTSTITMDDTVNTIEWVEVVFDASHELASQIEVVLTSPDGTQSILAEGKGDNWLYSDDYNQWTFTTCRNWGESAEGQWTLEVRDRFGGTAGVLNSWQLRVYGQYVGGDTPGPDAVVVGPELIAVLPNDGSQISTGDVLHVAPSELTFLFNERQVIDPTTLDGIRIARAGGDDVLGNANDVIVQYGWIGLGDQPNEVVVRFAETLPDDLYQITLFGEGDVVLKNIQGSAFHDGHNLSITFDLDLGAQVIAVVPQPVTRDPVTGALSQSRDTIEVYFNADALKLESVTNPQFYRLSQTSQTATPLDDADFLPETVQYDPVENKVVLTFSESLSQLAVGTLRLRIGNAYHRIDTSSMTAELVGDTFASAKGMGQLGSGLVGESVVISSIIEPLPYDLPWPGSINEVGHRELVGALSESHFLAGYDAGDYQYGAATYYYNFGPFGSFPNLVSSVQKQRVREIFEIYATLLGVQFIEDASGANRGFTVGTGDMRAVDPYVQTGTGGVIGIAGGGMAIMDNAETLMWGSSERGGAWFRTAMHEIGHLLGLGHTYDMPAYTVMGTGENLEYEGENAGTAYYTADSENIYPGAIDVIHGQYLYRPDGTDVDFYQFTVERDGVFSAETVAERLKTLVEDQWLDDASLLDSVISLYDSTGALIARNDDYYSEDSYLEVDLTPGTYYIAVSSTGNTEFDPDVADSGLGGTSQGKYDLRLTFQPKVLENGLATTEHLIDATGTLFDGDADSVPGGVYNFWFTSATAANTIFVDKIAPAGGNGSLAAPYQEIDQALAAAQPGQIVRIVGNRDRSFLEQTTFDVSFQPTGVAVGDFDGDGNVDIVAVNSGDDSVSILFGLGDGTYWGQIVRDVGRNPKGIAIGDVNGDGAPDIVVTNQSDRTISLLVNNGSGGFAAQQTRSVGFEPVAVELGDLNADGRLDIVVANRAEDTIGVLLNTGAGAFADQVTYAVGDAPADVALGDFNNDGILDVAVANNGPSDNRVSILLGLGNGTFAPASHATVGGRPISVAVGDLNRDGNRDLVAANYGSDNVSVLLGAGNGTFASPVNYAVGTDPSSVSLADLDDDGSLDIVTADEGNGTVTLLFGRPDGTFAEDPTVGPYDTGWTPKGLAVADMDGDGREDLVTTSFDDDEVSVILARRDAPYEIGKSLTGAVLPDGWKMEIPKGVTVMIDAGAVLKLRQANIDVGSSSEGIDRSLGALQILGTPELPVFFSSYHDKSIGEDHAAFDLAPQRGDWGGLVFRNKIDYDVRATDPNRVVLESEGIFLNYVNHAEIRYGGGLVKVNAVDTIFTPIQMIEARPTVSFNTIQYSANAAMSGDPNSFADTKFWGPDYITDYQRVGPDIHGNRVVNNSFNGLLVGINTAAGQPIDELEVAARWDDRDIVHIVAENLFINGAVGGPTLATGYAGLHPRLDARLAIDPGILVKLNATRIETEVGAQFIAEGKAGYPVVFTSIFDDRYGAGGAFDTTGNASSRLATPGDWGGLYFAPTSLGSIDNALVAYAGGITRIEGDFASFNPIEIQQGFVRLTNSVFENNKGAEDGDRNGRGTITEAVIFVRGAQPVLVGNVIRDNLAPAISIDANSLVAVQKGDWGRTTGTLAAYDGYPDNYGPLVRENRLANNDINGMIVRGVVLTTECVWDDTDIVHVVRNEIVVPNFHTYGGLRLQSSPDESLVVKLDGADAGFTALGTPQDIDDRIGGTLQIIGQPGYPVVLTALADDTIGAGFDPWGDPLLDTDNVVAVPVAGAWRSVKLEEYVNDRNVAIVLETEAAVGIGEDANGEPVRAQVVGSLAPHEQAGDDNLRLGFDVRGFIRSDDPTDVDVYSFDGRAGSEVWIDIDRTTMGLDSIVELVDADGNVFARSNDSPAEEDDLVGLYGLASTMDRDAWEIGDMYTVNVHDAGMRLVLPGAAGELRTYYVRVRSQDGASSGGYQLQIRLREDQEIAGSTILNSSIRYATNGIEILGLPTHSPLLGEAYEIDAAAEDSTQASLLLNLAGGDNNIQLDVNADPVGAPDVFGTLSTGIVVQFVDLGGTANTAIAQYNDVNRVLLVGINVGYTTGAVIANAINNTVGLRFTATLVEGDGAGVVADWGIVGVTSGGANAGNDRFENAEPLGRLLTSDSSQLLVGGHLSGPYDCDWYSFEVDLEQVQSAGGVTWPAIFDIDYGDGMARPDVNLYVFDADGVLIYSSLSSSVDDDQMAPAGAGTDDLTRGSGGAADPLLGPVNLPGGEYPDGSPVKYYVAITGAGLSAMSLFDYYNSFQRSEPVNSIERVAEEHVGMSLMSGVNTQVSLLPDTTSTELNVHIDDYNLSDVSFYVTNGTDLYTFDPFTGIVETDVTGTVPVLPDVFTWGAHYGDIAMRDDGRLMTLVDGAAAAAIEPYVGRYRELSTEDGTLATVTVGETTYVSDNDDGINVFRLVDGEVTPLDVGVQFTAMAHIPGNGSRVFVAVGHINADPSEYVTYGGGSVANYNNFLYVFQSDGTPIPAPGTPARDQLVSNVLPWAWLSTVDDAKITGLAFVGGDLCAVDELGKLYTIDNWMGGDASAETITITVGEDEKEINTVQFGGATTLTQVADFRVTSDYAHVEFTGLTLGPANVEEGAYAQTLFATATAGEDEATAVSRVMTFGADGELHYVLLDGKSDVVLRNRSDQPLTITTGLAFSNIDYNLWHITDNRYDDDGHGIEIAPDGSRPAPFYPELGNSSYWFGLEDQGPQAGVTNYLYPAQGAGESLPHYLLYGPNTDALDTYDTPDGAHGGLTTETFSLAGVSPSDAPKLTFNYFLETDGGSDAQITDSARVYISTDGVYWELLASNISRGVDAGAARLVETIHGVGDEGDYQWRQMEIGLTDYVGYDNLRLKFEFATSGSREVGSQILTMDPLQSYYTGDYLQALPGIELLDGQIVALYDRLPVMNFMGMWVEDPDAEVINFEFDLGYSLVAPNSAGLRILDGETFTITDGADEPRTITFEFDKNGSVAEGNVKVSVSDADSAAGILATIRSVVELAFFNPDLQASTVTGAITGDRIFLVGAAEMEQGAAPGEDEPAMLLDGRPGHNEEESENVLVVISPYMTDVEVAEELAKAMDLQFSQVTDEDGNVLSGDENDDLYTSVKKNEALLFVRNNHLVADPGPLPFFSSLDGQMGDAPRAGSQGGSGTQFNWNLRGQDNAHEGFYVDDIIIGFAERGEMHTYMTDNGQEVGETFFRPVNPGLAITEGYYQLEIRRASDYGSGAWDTNDRQGTGITIEAPAAVDIVHRGTFTVSDGTHTQTFQFIARPSADEEPLEGQDPDPGNIAISFTAGDPAYLIASRITTAINSATSLDVVASTHAGYGSNRVELHGAAWVEDVETLVFDNDGQNPTALVVVDLDPDPNPDLPVYPDVIAVNEYDGTISVMMNQFSSRYVFPVGYLPSDLATGDFNGDGFIDVAVSNAGDDTVSILLGNGLGLFEEQKVFSVGNEPVSIATYDLDADGRLDLVTANKSDNTVSILYGRGNGTFRKQQVVAVGRAPMDVALADVDRDALGDIVVVNSLDNSVWVLSAIMPGAYGPAKKYAVGRLPVSVAIGDLTPDLEDPYAPHFLDIVTANRTDGTVSVLIGDGQGNFLPAVDYEAGNGPVDVQIVDLDPPPPPEEGEDPPIIIPEVITAHFEANMISIFVSNATVRNTLSAPIQWGVHAGPMAVAVGDVVYADKAIDIVTAGYRVHAVTVLPCLAPIFLYDDPIGLWTGDGYLQQMQGDQNRPRQQGQLIIAANEILYSERNGITVDAGDRDSWAHPGSPAPLREYNQQQLVPGITIENNLVVASGEVGILFSGDGADNGAVPFGRITNNTVYGGAPPMAVEFLDSEDLTFVLPPELDDASIQVPLPFTFDFYGKAYTELFVNSNGNVTFDAPQFAYTAGGFPTGVAMFAPFWADVDTTVAGEIRAGTGTSVRGNPVIQIDWIDVGYFDGHSDKTNRFTLYIEDDPAGDIVVFKYWDMQWTTADPNGTNGFGGQGAEIGFDAGDGEHYISLMRPKNSDDLTRLMKEGMYVFRMDSDLDAPLLAGGVGIRVTQNASPTLLNNIVANLETGLLIDASSASTVVGGTVFQNNKENTVGTDVGIFPLLLEPDDPLFVDPLHNNFYLAAYSQAIDSSVDSLPDRPELIAVRDPLGIPESPILAPENDLFGQLRSDDPGAEPPPGMGSNVFKDRGAIDRVDFFVPMASLTSPLDNDAAGVDRNPAEHDVFVAGERLSRFTIQLTDGTGSGIDDFSVTSDTVKIYLDDSAEPLLPDVDYYFRYDTIRDIITLVPASGFWKEAATYTIVLDRSSAGIRDVAANALRANRQDNTTQFVVAISEFDYGDATDYPTLLAQDGARHMLIGGYYLGASVTGEKDAKLSRDQDGNPIPKDAAGDVGDDGVLLPSALLIGSDATLTVTASKSGGVLDAWADFNLDGDWDDPGEQIFDNKSLRRGKNTVTFAVPTHWTDPDTGEPIALDAGQTFLRFRYSRDGVDSPYGEAATGEVEDYRMVIVKSLVDYGDAPAPYPTLVVDDGASHELGGSLRLGQYVDEELDGQPHAAALGDDLNGPTGSGGVVNDEDGVSFLEVFQPNQTVSVRVTASTAGGYLNAWIDFNGDDGWGTDENDPEWIFRGTPLAAGVNDLVVTVPADAVEGLTFGRFRLSSQEVLLPTGSAPNGEVEDYQILIVATPNDYGDAPQTYGTVAQDGPASALVELDGANNDLRLTAVAPGADLNGVDVFIINNSQVASGDEAKVEYDPIGRDLRITVDPNATRAQTVVTAINAEGTFSARLDASADPGNDGSGLIKEIGKVATTAGGFDGFGDQAVRHNVGSGLLLGHFIDVEYDGQPHAQALGDDLAGLDDEDGIGLPAKIVSGLVARFVVEVTMGGAVTDAYLNAWIDANQDGVFSPSEQILTAEPVVDGTQEIAATIPATALSGETFIRFRLSSRPDLSPLGEAPDGEVEDYQIEITKGDAKISGTKFEDRNNNGVKDATEPGVPGVTIYLDVNQNSILDRDGDGAPIEPVTVTREDDFVTTDVNETGYYEFAGLLGQLTSYVVREELPTGWISTYPYAGVTLPDGSFGGRDANGVGFFTVFLEQSEHVANVNFGNYRKPHVTIDKVEVVEGNVGTTNVEVTLTLRESFGYSVQVDYATQDGTGPNAATIADNDYRAASGTVTFPSQAPPDPTWTLKTLTSNDSNDYDYQISGRYVVWEGSDGHDSEIYLYNHETGVITQLTTNDTTDTAASVFDTGAGPHVVWTSGEGADAEVWFHDGQTAIAVTSNGYGDLDPQVSGSYVTWWANADGDTDVFAWKIGQPVESRLDLSDNDAGDMTPRISGDRIVWTGYRNPMTTAPEDIEIFVFDGTENPDGTPHVVRVTSNSQVDSEPRIDGDLIVWQSLVGATYEIFLHDVAAGATTQVTSNTSNDYYPQISGMDVVWQGYDGMDWEIYHYNAESKLAPVNISQNSTTDQQPQVKDGRVTWQSNVNGNWDVMTRELRGSGNTTNVSNDPAYDWYPSLSDELVVWRRFDGDDYEIVVATPNEPETTQTITLRIVGDTKLEQDESFLLNLSTSGSVIFDVSQAEIVILNDDGQLDYGDAPDPTYPTLLANNGARHLIVPDFFLGAGVDAETNGQPNDSATGDDVAASDDEDGVVFNTVLGRGSFAELTVAASAAGYLDAWIDYNQDGDWDDVDEQVFASQPLVAGDNLLALPVSSNAATGQTFARFRFSANDGSDPNDRVAPTGYVPSGEVEDYRVEIVPDPPITNFTAGLTGTSGNDVFECWVEADRFRVAINGATYYLPRTAVNAISFDGRGGNDVAILHAVDGSDDAVAMSPGTASLAGADAVGAFNVQVVNVESISVVDGNDPADAAVLHGSTGSDAFVGGPVESVLSGAGYSLRAENFPMVQVHAGAGGTDTATLHASAGVQNLFVASPGQAEIGQCAPGDEFASDGVFHILIDGFASIHAQSTGTFDDRAKLYGSAGNDTFTGTPTSSALVGPGYELAADGFHTVNAIAGAGGTDRASFFDSPGNDHFQSEPAGAYSASYATLHDADNTYFLRAEGFRYNSATANAGGLDSALLGASTVNDLFDGHPLYSMISGPDYFNRVDLFEKVTADIDYLLGTGNSVARLYDSTGDDTFTVAPNTAEMKYSANHWVKAQFFRNVTAFAQSGGYDVATMYDTTGSDTYIGRPLYGQLYRTDGAAAYSFRAYSFDRIKVMAGIGTPEPGKVDVARLYDSALADLLEGDIVTESGQELSWARLSDIDGTLGYAHEVFKFDQVTAYSSSPGDRKKITPEAVALAFLEYLPEDHWTDW